MRQRGWHSIVVGMKQEEFALRTVLNLCAIFSAHITEKTSNLPLLGSPWQNGKRAQIRFQIQITFFPTGKSIQGCGIDGTTVFHSFDQSAARDRHIL